jgi:hypothetical protein
MIRNFGFGFFWLIFRRLFVSDRPKRGYFTRFSLPLFDFPRTIIWTFVLIFQQQ